MHSHLSSIGRTRFCILLHTATSPQNPRERPHFSVLLENIAVEVLAPKFLQNKEKKIGVQLRFLNLSFIVYFAIILYVRTIVCYTMYTTVYFKYSRPNKDTFCFCTEHRFKNEKIFEIPFVRVKRGIKCNNVRHFSRMLRIIIKNTRLFVVFYETISGIFTAIVHQRILSSPINFCLELRPHVFEIPRQCVFRNFFVSQNETVSHYIYTFILWAFFLFLRSAALFFSTSNIKTLSTLEPISQVSK